MSKASRNRVIYQNEFLYTSLDATGYHFENQTKSDPDCILRNVLPDNCSGNLVTQLHRIQAINYTVNTNYINVNQYGQLARVGGVSATNPDITLDFEYFLADGYNEQAVGFVTDGSTQALFNHMVTDGRFGQNFFISTAPEGHNIVNSNLDKFRRVNRSKFNNGSLQLPFQFKNIDSDITTLGIGNAFLSQYAVTAEVGSLPKARLSYDAFNVAVYKDFCNLPIPAVQPINSQCDRDIRFSLPDTYESFVYGKLKGMEDITLQDGVPGIRPNDISISLSDIGLISQQLNTESDYGVGSAHIQGFTINIPIGTTKVNRLGNSYSFTRLLNFPTRITIEVTAFVSELKKIHSAIEDMCSKAPKDIVLELYDCRGVSECNGSIEASTTNMKYVIKGALLESEGFSLDISNSKSVSMTLHATVSGPEDLDQGFFIYGKSNMPRRPQILSWGQHL